LLAALLTLSTVAPRDASAQGQTGTIIGRVTDAATGAPISSVNVIIAGTQLGTLTGDDGRFALRNINAGAVELVVNRIGYEPKRVPVTVVANSSATANVTLTQAAFSLAAVVTTVTGQTRKVELANTTAQIPVADKIAELPVSTMGQVLNGRASGVQVVSQGVTGGGSRIRIRGTSSLSLSNDPVIIVDGVRISSGTGSLALGVGGSGPSRLDDINPDEIENIEIIKGPSAATLYGTEAANGVINITTKRGKAGKTRLSVYTENGIIKDPRKGAYPNMYALWGRTATSATPRICTLANTLPGATGGAATCSAVDSLSSGNILNIDSLTPIDQGNRQQYGAQISGGNDRVQFFVSGETENELGVYKMPDKEVARLQLARGVGALPSEQVRPNALGRNSLRANVSAQLAEKLFVQVSSAYVNSITRFPQNEDNSTGLMVDALGGQFNQSLTDAEGTRLQGYRSYPMGDILSVTTTQGINRFINSVAAQYNPLSWLATRATVGLDYTARLDKQYNRVGEGPNESTIRPGNAANTRTELSQQTVDLGATGSWGATSWLQTKTSVGMQYIRNLDQRSISSGLGLPPGILTVSAAATRTSSESTQEKRTLGYYAEEVLSIADKLFITGGVRRDAASAFGKDFRAVNYPKIGASWLVSEQGFFPKPEWLNTFRVRATYGASGQIPGPNDALRYFSPFSATLPNGSDAPSISLGALGNAKLKPEFSAETEAGFDLTLFNGKTNLVYTFYNKETTDALIQRQVAPSLAGLATRFENIGDIKNSGNEIELSQNVFDRTNFAASFTITASTNKNKMTKLAEGVPALFTGNRNTQRNQPGYPLYGLWGRTYTFQDKNNDGVLAYYAPGSALAGSSEITFSDSAVFIGPSFPTKEAAFSPTVELFGRKLRLSGQVDGKFGHKKFNNTLRHQCQGGASCRGLFDKSAPLETQAAAVAANVPGIFTGMYENGDFVRFREASASLTMPTRWANALRAERWNIVLTGRNLGVSTKYKGVDPEAAAASTDVRGNEEYFATAPQRYFTLRMNFNF
jgi:TonB-linked SusC/RagA family outer membrane protein